MMKELLTILQLVILLAQIIVLVVGIKRNKDLIEFCYGYALWAAIPNTAIWLYVRSL